MVNVASVSKSTQPQGKSTRTSIKTGPPSKKPLVVSTAKIKKTRQENIKKHTDENENPESAYETLHAQLKKLQADNDVLRKAATAQPKVHLTIPRPNKGVGSKGFNLRTAMRLEDDKYQFSSLRRCVRSLANRAGLDYTVPWRAQPKEKIGQIIGAARERHQYFTRFPHGWPVEEFLKTYLKNQRSYARKRGYLGDNTNQKQDEDEDDDDDDVNDVDDEKEKGKQKQTNRKQHQEAEEEEESHEWTRGNGWYRGNGSGSEDDDIYASERGA